jgi:hypothetical protein
MSSDLPFRDWSRNAGVFLASCLVTSALMRLLMREYEFVFSLSFALCCLAGSSTLAWFALKQWRTESPFRCAFELGICGGIGGPGLHTLFGYGLTSLFPPYFGPVQNAISSAKLGV